MKYEFDSSHGKYIKATASGLVTKTDLIAAISELMQHPDYSHKHSLWIFSNVSLGVDIDGLKKVADAFSLYRPKQADFANKSAIVVPNNMYKAIINLSITIATGLPFEFQAFTDKDEAMAFLCSEYKINNKCSTLPFTSPNTFFNFNDLW